MGEAGGAVMTTRRLVGAYEWRNQLDAIKGIGERIKKELTEMGKNASTVETSRRITELVSLSSDVSVKALELKGYKVKDEPTTTAST